MEICLILLSRSIGDRKVDLEKVIERVINHVSSTSGKLFSLEGGAV